MIYDTLKNGGIYHSVHSEFKKAFTFLCGKNILTLPTGKYKIGRKGTFALVQEYSTREESEGFIECHRKYIDIQYLAKGVEKIGVCAKSACTPMIPYDAEKDFQKLKGKVDFITLQPGAFTVFFPEDGHMPAIRHGNKQVKVRKIVVKVPVNP
ncbi:MAG: YhcH/YjgK/YiaL family protein, partial [Victivallales bacterium]